MILSSTVEWRRHNACLMLRTNIIILIYHNLCAVCVYHLYFHRRFKYCVVSGYIVRYTIIRLYDDAYIVFNCKWRRIIKSPRARGEAPIWEIILILYNNIPRFLGTIYNNYYLQNGTYTAYTHMPQQDAGLSILAYRMVLNDCRDRTYTNQIPKTQTYTSVTNQSQPYIIYWSGPYERIPRWQVDKNV